MPTCLDAFLQWRSRRWLAATLMAAFTMLAIGLPTDVIANPVFGRGEPVTDWALPVLGATAVLSGLLFATYVRNEPRGSVEFEIRDRMSTLGSAGAFISLFAVGCPTCNKLVLLALGSSGALSWFAPVQPYLASASLVLLVWSLRTRVLRESSCRLPSPIQ